MNNQGVPDITNQTKEETKGLDHSRKEIGLSEERYRSLVIATAQVVWTTSPDGLVIDIPMWRELTGQSIEENRGWGWLDAIHPDDRHATARAWDEAIKTRSIYETEYRIRMRDGSYRYFMARGIPVFEADGEIREWMGVCIDIHDKKIAEEISSHITAIVESSDDAIISKSLEGIILSWNKGAERIFGYIAEEVIGRSIYVLIPPERTAEEPKILERLRRGERIDHYETIRVAKNGSLLNISLTVSPIKNSSGQVIAVSKIARDITEKKRADAALREQIEVVETINRIGQLLSVELDQQKLVQAVTDAATELTDAEFGAFFYNMIGDSGESYMLYTLSGVPREAFANFPMPRNTEMFGPTFRGEGTIRIGNVKEDPRYGKNEPYYGMPSGHLPVTSYLAIPVASRTGEVIGGLFFGHSEEDKFTERHERIIEGLASQVAVAMDNARLYNAAQRVIKERQELLESEQEARKQAEVASRAKDEFLSLLSHELRTPLNAILGWTRMLATGNLDDSTFTKALETIDRNAKLQARLIEDMLDVSRIISGKLRLDAQPVDLTMVINTAVDTLRPAAEAKDIRVQVIMDFGAGSVLGDPVRLQQVVWNLLSNAIKFTPKQGRVQIQLTRINSHIELIVSDTGTGIEEDFLPHVFDRFRQGDSSSTKKFGGLGLGLAIVRHLVELHGGSIEANNRTDIQGAIFSVKLPVIIVRPTTANLYKEELRVHPAVSSNISFDCPPQLDGIKILAVDDEKDSRDLLKMVLESCGAEVQTCGSVSEAMKFLEEYEPDILVSDIGMPEEDGYQFIKKVRAKETKEGTRKIPAVALTAYARVEDRLQVLSAGFNMHVPKPVEPVELTVVIASLVNQNNET